VIIHASANAAAEHRIRSWGDHRLMPPGGEIYNGEAAVNQADTIFRLKIAPLVIRPAMGDNPAHLFQQGTIKFSGKPGNTAHYKFSACGANLVELH